MTRGGGQDKEDSGQAVKEVCVRACVCLCVHACVHSCIHGIHLVCCQKDFIV